MTQNQNLLENIKRSSGTVVAANGGNMKVVLKPRCQQEAIPVKEVQLLSQLSANQMSVSHIVKNYRDFHQRRMQSVHDNNLFKLEQHRQDALSANLFVSCWSGGLTSKAGSLEHKEHSATSRWFGQNQIRS